MQTEECIDAATTGARTAQVVQHVKENNIAYLVGVFIAHQMGLLGELYAYGAGICV